jgi:YebC/PmpR family DNA-binding regulatory protein
VTYEEFSYEGYGPGGVAVLVDIMTDNRNRTAAEIRHIFSKSNGNLGENGCVAWMFDKKGLIVVDQGSTDEETLMDVALEAGADDVRDEEDVYEVYTPTDSFDAVRQAFEEREIPLVSAEITMVPRNTIRVEGREAEQMLRLLERLEECDDVQNVHANFDIDDELMEQLQG